MIRLQSSILHTLVITPLKSITHLFGNSRRAWVIDTAGMRPSSSTDYALVYLHDLFITGTPSAPRRALDLVSRKSSQVFLVGGSILTSRALFVGLLKDHPLSLLLAHVSILAALQTRFLASSKDHAATSLITSREFGATWFLFLVIIACVCLISAYKTIRFAGSLPTAIFLLSIHFSADPSDHFVWSTTRYLVNTVARAILFIAGFTLVLVWDYRLNITSRDMSIAFLISSHMLVRIPAIAATLQDQPRLPWLLRTTYRPIKVRHLHLCTLPLLSIVAHLDQGSRPFVGTLSTSNCTLLLANLVLTAGAWLSIGEESSIEPLFCESLAGPHNECLLHRDNWAMLALSGFISMGSWLLPGHTVMTSPWQILGYMTALALSKSFSWKRSALKDSYNKSPALLEGQLQSSQHAFDFGNDSTFTKQSKGNTSNQARPFNCTVISAVMLWFVFAFTTSLKPELPDYNSISINDPATSSTDFDIVVATHDRPGIDIAKDINSILSLRVLQNHTTRVNIYNKGTEINDSIRRYLRNETALRIEELENKGREGGTYLHHIVSQWESLARHTLFIQEQAHDFTLLKQRIADYLVPETGFMSLSYEGKTWKQCEHLRIGSWPAITESISRVTSMLNTSDTCQDPVLTFRGQFVASGARIRGNGKALYAELLDDLINGTSWMHTPEMLQSPWADRETDSLKDPVFGYTLERLWGVILQCSNSHIVNRSPSLLGSYVRSVWFGQKVAIDDTQCLDGGPKDH